MLEAVARGKAHGLFDSRRSAVFGNVRRPQEDMVTSAVFGSATLLPMPDRRAALDLLIGADCLGKSGFQALTDVAVAFWPSFQGTSSRQRVEPDVLLTCGDRTVIVEVKWHAALPSQQLEDEIDAVRADGRSVAALLLLGEAGTNVPDTINGVSVVGRTWRAVSADLARTNRDTQLDGGDEPLDRWRHMLHAFLHRTDLGHIFAGLDAKVLGEPGQVAYRLRDCKDQQWFSAPIRDMGQVAYRFGKGV